MQLSTVPRCFLTVASMQSTAMARRRSKSPCVPCERSAIALIPPRLATSTVTSRRCSPRWTRMQHNRGTGGCACPRARGVGLFNTLGAPRPPHTTHAAGLFTAHLCGFRALCLVQTLERHAGKLASWQNPHTRRYSREFSESGIRAVQCYDRPTAQCGGGHDKEVGRAKSETRRSSRNCHARRHPTVLLEHVED